MLRSWKTLTAVLHYNNQVLLLSKHSDPDKCSILDYNCPNTQINTRGEVCIGLACILGLYIHLSCQLELVNSVIMSFAESHGWRVNKVWAVA